MADENRLTVGELISQLQNLPSEVEVYINGELGWYPLVLRDVDYAHVYRIWHSDYNNNHTPYEDYCREPRNGKYVRGEYMGHKLDDYVFKTVGEADIVILG